MELVFKDDGSFAGRATEPATFGDGTSQVLRADIAGQVIGTAVSFSKHYDGTGGVRHTVEYRGVIDPERTAMSGNWTVPGAQGTFTANIEHTSEGK